MKCPFLARLAAAVLLCATLNACSTPLCEDVVVGKAADATPMANVFLPLLHMLGLDDVTTLGDSSGELELNAAASTTVAEA